MWYETPLERGMFPDPVVRLGIRRRLAARLKRERAGGPEARRERFRGLVGSLRERPIAIETDAANEQHYELPPEFFEAFLGKHLKYSCGYWPDGVETLDDSERAMLELYCKRARLEDGMSLLDLGCGWGSLSLYVCQMFPSCRVTAVSNSAPQRAFIEARARALGLTNLTVHTADANVYDPGQTFDRVISVEMLEHVKNYPEMLGRISRWLHADGLCFVHIFTHTEIAYEYEASDDWIGRYFFTGGNMPSDDLLLHFQDDVQVVDHWVVDGTNYGRTSNAWLAKYDENSAEIRRILENAYGPGEATKWFNRWRVFLMACAELWNFRNGSEWVVSHYLFQPRRSA